MNPQEEPQIIANLEAEQALLGAMMIDNRCADDVADILSADDFFDPVHQRIFAATMTALANGKVASPVTLKPLFETDPGMIELGGVGYLAGLTAHSAAFVSIRGFADQILQLARLRRTIEALQNTLGMAQASLSEDIPLSQVAEAADAALNEALTGGDTELPGASIGRLFREALDDIEAERRGELPAGLECAAIPDLKDLIGGMRPQEVTVIAGRPGMGKAQPLDAKVLTCDGWVEMGSLAIGDELVSHDGRRSQVTGVFPQGVRDVFRVTLSDGRTTECCAEHLWRVRHRKWPEPRVMQTRDIMALLEQPQYHRRLSLDIFAGHFGVADDLPVDPWLLGCLLGDGSLGLSSVRISTPDQEILQRISRVLPPVLKIHHEKGVDYRISGTRCGNAVNPLLNALRALGLAGKTSEFKFVPAAYLNAPNHVRIEVLRGLLDTDGWVEKHGTVRFSSASKQLALDVQYLVRSLGGLCRVSVRQPHFTVKGVRKPGLPAYSCTIRHIDAARFVTLPRKAERAERVCNGVRLSIWSIEHVRKAECQCISVSHPDRLYVTDDFVVTHNTALGLSLALGVAELGHGVAFISREMSRGELAKRMLADRIFDHGNCPSFDDVKSGKFTQDDYRKIAAAQKWADGAAFEVVDKGGAKIGQIVMALRRLKRRMAAKGQKLELAVIDYLQLVEPDKKTESRTQDVGYVSRKVKQAAKDLGIHIILLAQLSREVEKRDDKHPVLSDLRDSGEIEQDADNVVFLYREEYYLKLKEPAAGAPGREAWETKLEASRNKLEIYSAKRRNGETARRHLWFFLANQAVRGSRYFEDRR